MNEQLAKICPYPVDFRTLDSPNTKTNLLLQAHFSRLPLPIRDYLTDTKTVIDASIRILHAMIDLSAEQGFLNTSINLIGIMQQIFQGVWVNDSGLRNVPFFTNEIIQQLYNKNIRHLCQLLDFKNSGKLEKFLSDQRFGLYEDNISEIIGFLDYIPQVTMRAKINAYNSELNQVIEDENVLLEEGSEAQVTINLKRINKNHSLRLKMMAIQKIKDASWFVLVGSEYTNQLFALKKIILKDKSKKQIQIQLPNQFEKSPKLNVYLFSDSYIGIDQIRQISLEKRREKVQKNKN